MNVAHTHNPSYRVVVVSPRDLLGAIAESEALASEGVTQMVFLRGQEGAAMTWLALRQGESLSAPETPLETLPSLLLPV